MATTTKRNWLTILARTGPITTGRISTEMLLKTAEMEVPVIISRTSPTSLAIKLAREWGVTLIGYVRAGRMNVYAGEERLLWGST